MTAKRINQHEAQALRRRVIDLEAREEARRSMWVNDYPGGTHIASVTVNDVAAAKIRTARVLRHAIVVTNGTLAEIHFYALPVAKETDA